MKKKLLKKTRGEKNLLFVTPEKNVSFNRVSNPKLAQETPHCKKFKTIPVYCPLFSLFCMGIMNIFMNPFLQLIQKERFF